MATQRQGTAPHPTIDVRAAHPATAAQPQRRRRSNRLLPMLLTAVLLVLAVLGLAGCGKSEFKDRTARVTVDGRGTQYTVDSCGLDGRTLFVVGRADDGSVLQAVLGLTKDRKKGVTASSGFSVTQGPTTLEAFGQESWGRRGKTGPAPGEITSAQLRGSRIQFGGRARYVDTDEVPTSPESIDVSIDARCDQRNDRPAS